MGNYSQLMFYGFCILLVNNIGNSDGTFFGLLSQASSGAHGGGAASSRTSVPASGAAVGGVNNELLLQKLTQISSKLSLLIGGLGGGGGGVGGGGISGGLGVAAGAGPAAAAEEITSTDDDVDISPKIGSIDNDETEPAENQSDTAENEITVVRKQSNNVQTRNGNLGNGRQASNGNGFQLRKSITTSNSGRAGSIGQVSGVRTNISPGVLAAISTSNGGNQNSVLTAQRSGGNGYNYQNPGYRYRTVRYY